MPDHPKSFRPVTGAPNKAPKATHNWGGRQGNRHDRGYDTEWDKARRLYIDGNPLCEMCDRKGRVSPVEQVDHIIPFRSKEDRLLRLQQMNFQSVCTPCHRLKERSQILRYEIYIPELGRVASFVLNGYELIIVKPWGQFVGKDVTELIQYLGMEHTGLKIIPILVE